MMYGKKAPLAMSSQAQAVKTQQMAARRKSAQAQAVETQQMAAKRKSAQAQAAKPQQANANNLLMAQKANQKKGMAKGGMANCGASMKPAQGRGK